MMGLEAIAQARPALQNVRLVATDMDGTLTIDHKFSARLLESLESLAAVGMPVVIVTGRSAGWVSGVVSYLPIAGAIAENGGIFYRSQPETAAVLVEIADLQQHRHQLAAMFKILQSQFPQIGETADNQFRLTDWTFDVAGLTVADLETMGQICGDAGWDLTYSTVQVHIKKPEQEKARGLWRVVRQQFPDLAPPQILTLGDSLNDESLFDPQRFPLSVGVANVRDYCDRLQHQPRYITDQAEGYGFAELVDLLLAQQKAAGGGPRSDFR